MSFKRLSKGGERRGSLRSPLRQGDEGGYTYTYTYIDSKRESTVSVAMLIFGIRFADLDSERGEIGWWASRSLSSFIPERSRRVLMKFP